MRSITVLCLLLGLALGACAKKTPPPKSAEPARAADAMESEPARPAATTGDAGVTQPDMAAPRPADMGAPADGDK